MSYYRDNILSPVRATLIVRLMIVYKFVLGEFFSREMRDRSMGGDKSPIVYS